LSKDAVLRTERIPVNSQRLFVPCEKRHFSPQLSSRLSRACLGKSLGFQKKNGTQRKKTAASFSAPIISSVVFEMFRKSLPSIRFEAKMHQRLICVYSSVTVSGVPWSQGVPRIRLSLHPTVSCTPSQASQPASQPASQSVSHPHTPSNDRSSQLRSAPVRFTYE
jgi:hypothetical protein